MKKISKLEADITQDILDALDYEVKNNGDILIDGMVPLTLNSTQVLKAPKANIIPNKKDKLFRPLFVAVQSENILRQKIVEDYPDTFIKERIGKKDELVYYSLIVKEDGEILMKSDYFIHSKFSNFQTFLCLYLDYTKEEAKDIIINIYEANNEN